MNMNEIKFAIIGCGTIGDVHARAIMELEGAVIAAVCDFSFERAKEFAARYDALAYSDYDELLKDESIDVISICTPSGLHANQTIAALNAGKHVLVEKPMALNSKDAEAIVAASKKSNKITSVVFQSRYMEDVKELKRLIDSGELGNIILCDMYMKYWRDEEYFKVSKWRGTFAMDGGGALMNQGIHGIDLLHYLLGKPKLISAKVKTLRHNIETEDTAVAAVEYPCGALGVIEAATSTPPGFGRRIEVHGTRGYAVLCEGSLEKIFIDGKYIIDEDIKIPDGSATDPSKMKHDKHLLQYSNFIGAIKGNEEILSSAEDGYNAVNFIEQIYESSKNGGIYHV